MILHAVCLAILSWPHVLSSAWTAFFRDERSTAAASAVGSLGAAVAALISGIATLATVLELRAARHQAVLPYIVSNFSPNSISAVLNTTGISFVDSHRVLHMILTNEGSGVAINPMVKIEVQHYEEIVMHHGGKGLFLSKMRSESFDLRCFSPSWRYVVSKNCAWLVDSQASAPPDKSAVSLRSVQFLPKIRVHADLSVNIAQPVVLQLILGCLKSYKDGAHLSRNYLTISLRSKSAFKKTAKSSSRYLADLEIIQRSENLFGIELRLKPMDSIQPSELLYYPPEMTYRQVVDRLQKAYQGLKTRFLP